MDVVVDANILIAVLISPSGHTADLLFSPVLRIFAPELLLEEVEEHKNELLKKTGFSEKDFNQLIVLISKRIIFFPIIDFLPFIQKAKEICPDPDDAAYFALALKLHCPLWSNDKKLKGHEEVKVFSTSELLALS